MFSCLQFCEEREFWPDTRDSNPWKLEWNIYALPTELAGLEQTRVTLFSVSNLTCIASFFDSYAFAALRDFFCVTVVISYFSCFPASYFSKQEFFRPTRDFSPWALDQKSNALLMWLSGLDESFVLLFLAVILNVRPDFSSVLLLPHRSWWFFLDHGSLLRISMFPCFQFCEKKGVLATHKRLKPLKFGIKYLRSTDWASGARTDACHLVFCF